MNSFDSSRRVLKFGVFEADLAAGELRKNGAKLRLQDQPFHVLALLLENPGQVVSREELRRKLWPADTFVDFDNGLNTAINKIREALGDSAENPKFVETLPRRGYRFLQTLEQKAEKSIDTIVVLPLENLSHDPEQEYFAEGMTEALITTLAKIGALRVVSRTTAMHYKGVHRPLREIASELQVGGVVEGTVLRSGDRVRISAQLIDARVDIHIWAESYDRELRDVLALQSEVAQSIAREIQVKLTPRERARIATSRTVDPEAYEAYLKGRYHWNRRRGESLEIAARYFQQAVEKDPSYAAGYAGLADCANSAGWWCLVSPEEGCNRAKIAARKALELDDSLSDAHVSLGFGLLYYDYDFVGAEKELHRAMELDPANSTAVFYHAVCLVGMCSFEEASAEILRAARLDPLSRIIATVAGMILYLAHRFEQGIEMCRRVRELDPNFPNARWAVAVNLAQIGKHEEAIAEMEDVVHITKRAPLHLFMLGHCYATAGRRNEALRIVEELQDLSRQRYITPYWPAVIYAGLNEKDKAMVGLEAAYRGRCPWVIHTKGYAGVRFLENLRSDPRFEDLIRRMNYPPHPHCTMASR